jgi:hypothetical protein
VYQSFGDMMRFNSHWLFPPLRFVACPCIDPLTCSKCGSEMKILSVIMDTCEIKKVLKHLIKTNKAPPGIDEKVSVDE